MLGPWNLERMRILLDKFDLYTCSITPRQKLGIRTPFSTWMEHVWNWQRRLRYAHYLAGTRYVRFCRRWNSIPSEEERSGVSWLYWSSIHIPVTDREAAHSQRLLVRCSYSTGTIYLHEIDATSKYDWLYRWSSWCFWTIKIHTWWVEGIQFNTAVLQ